MKVMAAGKAKNGFGLLMDLARAAPVTIEKHGRPVVVVMSVEEYERLTKQKDVPDPVQPEETAKPVRSMAKRQ